MNIKITLLILILPLWSFSQEVKNFDTHNHSTPAFVPNHGQWKGNFSHVFRSPRYDAYLTPQGITITMTPIGDIKEIHDAAHDQEKTSEPMSVSKFSYSILYLDGNLDAEIIEENKTSLKRNYFIGSNSNNWHTGLQDANIVKKESFYPGVNIVYKAGSKSSLEFDYIIEPNINPSLIKWTYRGIDNASLSPKGIAYNTPYGTIREIIPEAYQIINGRKIKVEVAYAEGDGFYSFQVGDYNANYALVIDPIIVAATLTGSLSNSNFGHGATYDQENNVFSFGRSFGTGLPVSDGAVIASFAGGNSDAVINKFNPTGTEQIYATYLGGVGEDLPHSAITNNSGDLFVFGTTASTNFPTHVNALQSEHAGDIDIFISRISPDGTELIASTLLGGAGIDGRNPTGFGYESFRGELSLDPIGNVFLASATQSSDFPTSAGAYSSSLNGLSDGVMAKFSPDLSSAEWITLIGGDGDDMIYNVRIKDNGSVVFSGTTQGSTFETTAGAYQETAEPNSEVLNGTVGILSANGSNLLQSTFAATSALDRPYFADLDNDENIWIYGRTEAPEEWPVTDGVFTTIDKSLFITKLTPDLSEVLVSTLIGEEEAGGWANAGNPVAFLVDRCDRVYISAFNVPANLPLTDDALYTSGGFYVAAFEEDLTILSFASYYSESHVDGGTSRFDKKGVIYQGVCSGGNFDTTNDAYATNQSIGWDVGVFKIDFELSGVNASFSAPSELSGCVPHTIDFSNFSVGDVFEWNFGDGSPVSNEFEPSHEYTEVGQYNISLIASDSLSCNLADTVNLVIDIFSPTDFNPSFSYDIDCETGIANFTNTTGGENFLDYIWIVNGDSLYTSYNSTHAFDDIDALNLISLYAVDEGCEIDQAVTQEITSLPTVEAMIGGANIPFCGNTVSFENESTNGLNYLWDFGDGQNSTIENPSHEYSSNGEFTVLLSVFNPNSCNQVDSIERIIEIIELPVYNDAVEVNQLGNCSEMTFDGELIDPSNISGVVWYLEGEAISSGDSFSSSVDAPGQYILSVDITPAGCPNPVTSFHHFTVISDLGVDLGPDKYLCYNEDFVTLENLTAIDATSYHWMPNGQTSTSINVSELGEYSVIIETALCTGEATVLVSAGIEQFTSYDLETCENTNTLLEVPVEHLEFLWDNGSDKNTIYVNEGGIYPFTYVDLKGCSQAGEVRVEGKNPDPLVYIPNAFTPNGDGFNDLYKVSAGDLDVYSLEIFNRWGQSIFHTNDHTEGWDGSNNNDGFYVPTGVYPYIVKYSGVCSTDVEEKTGSVTIIR